MDDDMIPYEPLDWVTTHHPQETDTAEGVQDCPVTIYVKNMGPFVVSKVGGWAYQDWGIFATGSWQTAPALELDILIPYQEIKYMLFDFASLARWLDSNPDQGE